MRVWKVQKGELIAKRQDKVMEWYLIQEGSVGQLFAFEEITLGRNSMIGILENEWFMCDYVAKEDTTLIVIQCKNAEDLQKILSEHENFRVVFLRAALEQKYKSLNLYTDLQKRTTLLHQFAESAYNDYKAMCQELLAQEQPFPRMESFEALSMVHRADTWEINSNNSLMTRYLKEYLLLMIKDDAMCVGAIMEAAAQVRRVTQGIGEMVSYLQYNKEILWAKSQNDLFHLFFDLAMQQSKEKKDIGPIQQEMEKCHQVMCRLGIYDEDALARSHEKFKNYDFESVSNGRINAAKEDCLRVILNYAGYDVKQIEETEVLVNSYYKLPDKQSTEQNVYQLRKKITRMFYDVYEKAFFRAVEDEEELSPILMMFFNFGFMDVRMVGEENTNALYNLTDHLGMFHSENIFTVYEWLRAIYKGQKEPSRNELDLDYNGYLLEERRSGNITEKQAEEYKSDTTRKVSFEIHNMFPSGHRMTYGRVTTFCPILAQDDLINSVEKLALTAERLMQALNLVRELDYSVLYRDILFSDPAHGISQEWIMKEILPDMILMPGVGVKGAMWQETSGAKT
ncbi:MAG: cyclic nucleotide-binding domain-containing protein, partial [Agathobacter sp.]|nr:cyclic nucleotide-binding domain-containing protein [Agathobacter sp.]